MAKIYYHGKIEHNEKTVEQLYETQYFAFEKSRVAARVITGFAMIVAAFFLNIPIWAKGILLLIGAWLLASRGFQGQIRADKAIQNRKTGLPVMEYDFYSDNFRVSGEGSMSIPYKKLIRLVKDSEYFYLFSARDSVCMVDRASITPDGKCDELMTLIEEKTGLTFREEKSLLALNLYDITSRLKDVRTEKRSSPKGGHKTGWHL